MNSSELHEAFRTDIGVNSPAVLSDDEVWRYMNDAYRNFVRLTGGIPDFTTPAVCSVRLVPTVATAAIDKSILKVVRATRTSDGREVKVINAPDLHSLMLDNDYGQLLSIATQNLPGPVNYMMIGAQQKLVQWVQVPQAIPAVAWSGATAYKVGDLASFGTPALTYKCTVANTNQTPPNLTYWADTTDTVNLTVFRLPLVNITTDGQELVDVAEQHHINLLDWMKKLAHSKSDPELFDPKRAQAFGASFLAYCEAATAEVNRFKHKTRVTAYGGL